MICVPNKFWDICGTGLETTLREPHESRKPPITRHLKPFHINEGWQRQGQLVVRSWGKVFSLQMSLLSSLCLGMPLYLETGIR